MKASPKSDKKRDLSNILRNRIVGHGFEKPENLRPNPKQWKRHEKEQTEPLEALLEKVGWVQSVIFNVTTKHLIDGHYRVESATKRGEKRVPVVYVKLSQDEEDLVLALLDPITGLAKVDDLRLEKLLADLEPENVALESLIAKLEGDLGLGGNGAGELAAGDEIILDQAVQLEPGKEYIVVMCDDEEEFADLRSALDLQMVRRGGYKTGSPFDARGIERVVPARRLFAVLKGKRKR